MDHFPQQNMGKYAVSAALFDKLRRQPRAVLTSKTAVLFGCIPMASADGSIDDDLALLRGFDGTGDTRIWQAAVKTFQMMPRPEAIEAVCAALAPYHVMPFLANRIDLAMTDGELASDEKGFAGDLCRNGQSETKSIEDAVPLVHEQAQHASGRNHADGRFDRQDPHDVELLDLLKGGGMDRLDGEGLKGRNSCARRQGFALDP